LIGREKELRYQLTKLRGRAAVEPVPELGESLRGGKALDSISAAALQELQALSRAYESVVTQLQLGTRGLAGVSVPAPFALDKFRNATNAAFGVDWTALDYYLADDTLTVVVVSPTETRVERKALSTYDRAILEQCAGSEPDLRELIYRGTLRGAEVPSAGASYLQRLYSLLIPGGLGTTLIISPHGVLHGLPFHALMDGATYLIEQHTLVYLPCLQALQLLTSKPGDGNVMQPLVVGISNFGDQMRPLPAAAVEVDLVRRMFGEAGTSLLEGQATRRKILELDAAGELQKYNVLHFATHAILDRVAPHQSGVILADDTLTVMDILDLSLDARLVTLSACQTALGEGGQGDELVDLARAFFYAGARALLATLWHVGDQPMAELTEWFYRYLTQGENAAVALRQAQIEMIRAGRLPYQWASFALIGRP
jgi:CHAT domain-containing protein